MFGLLPSLACATSGRPAMQPLDQRLEINLHRDAIDLRLPILSDAGQPLYWLRCLGGSETSLDSRGEKDGNNYVPPLACVLVEQADGWNASLLSEDEAAVWYSRGQYHGTDLIGECGHYPEFGRVRHFRLRGMQLTLEAEHVVAQDNDASRFTLHVTATADPSALTARAQRPDVLPPRQDNCQVVRHGSEPLMCRNEKTMSWQTCSPKQIREMGYPETKQS